MADFFDEAYPELCNPREQRRYAFYFISTDGEICDRYYRFYADVYDEIVNRKRFNEFKTKREAEIFLYKLKNYAKNKDYSDIEMGKAYFIGHNGIIYNQLFCPWDVEGMKSIGNWFKTKEEAEIALNKLKEIM